MALRLGVLLLAAVLLAACQPSTATLTPAATGQSSASAAGPVSVTLGIYSGRPDPEWSLTADQAAALDGMLAALPAQTATPPDGGLGYHGFTIRRPLAAQADATLVAYRGSIAPPGTGPRTVRADAARSIERYLLDTGRAGLSAVEIAEVEAALR